MFLRRPLYASKIWIIYHLDQFVSWTPLVQIPILLLLTTAIVSSWALVFWLHVTGAAPGDSFWWALSRFADGGTMAGDRGSTVRVVAVGVTASGVLLLSLLTGAFASKLSERIDDLRLGRSPVVERNHVLILGFDAKVPEIAREFGRSHERITLVTLAEEDKARQEALLRSALRLPRSRVRVVCRTGDPRLEQALLRVSADRARSILVVANPSLTDDHALRWTLSTLLALRRVTGPDFAGRIIVDARRATHESLLSLAAEAGLAGECALPIEIIASDDIIARVIAQAVRHGVVHLALRELLSFRGSEFYLEPVPRELVGGSFENAYARIHRAVAVGVFRRDGTRSLAPARPDVRPLEEEDQLILLETDAAEFSLGAPLPSPPPIETGTLEVHPFPRSVAVLGYNRSLACLVTELDLVMQPSSSLKLCYPELPAAEEEEVERAARACRHVQVERFKDVLPEAAALADTDGVVILGCEDEHDPDGDSSALALLLQLRRAQRERGSALKRLVTEVRNPGAAHQIKGNLDDFLVSTDVVAMMLAQAALHPSLTPVYREVLDPGGAEIFIHPLSCYGSPEPATFAEVMAGARLRGEIAIGVVASERAASLPIRTQIELGETELDASSPVYLNPPRERVLSPDWRVVVLSSAGAPR